MFNRLVLSAALTLVVLAGPAAAQTDAMRAMVGTWELSDADHERFCTATFKLNPIGTGFGLDLEPKCIQLFPSLRGVVAWSFGRRDMLVLNTAAGQTVLELLEAEAGTYEGLRPNEGRYILQNAAVV